MNELKALYKINDEIEFSYVSDIKLGITERFVPSGKSDMIFMKFIYISHYHKRIKCNGLFIDYGTSSLLNSYCFLCANYEKTAKCYILKDALFRSVQKEHLLSV